MDYENYVKQKYMKMALKGIHVPFSERWEYALVGMQCLAAVNSKLQANATKLLEGVPDNFNDAFSNGIPLTFDPEGAKWLSLYLRVQNLMRVSLQHVGPNLTRLEPLILPSKEKIDEGVFKYYAGNRALMAEYTLELKSQIKAIDASVQASFAGATQDIEGLKSSLAAIYEQTDFDLQAVLARFSKALDLTDVIMF